MSNIVIVILAAGASSRLGHSKQLIEFNGKTLLQHSIENAKESRATKVFVVLGHQFDRLNEHIKSSEVIVLNNLNWTGGMGASLSFCLRQISSLHPDTDAVLISTCDQPFVNAAIYNKLIDIFEDTNCAIVACRYLDVVGVPALFSRLHFAELSQLSGREGARKIIQRHIDATKIVDFPHGAFDIDTTADLQTFFDMLAGSEEFGLKKSSK